MALTLLKALALAGVGFALAPITAMYVVPSIFKDAEPPPSVNAHFSDSNGIITTDPDIKIDPLPLPSTKPQMTIIAPGLNGKFVVHARIRGITVPMVFDTGATVVALTYEDSARIGIRANPDSFTTRIETANGSIKGAEVMLPEIRVDSIIIRNVPAVILPKGSMKSSLLGRTFWGRLGTGFSFDQGNLVLKD